MIVLEKKNQAKGMRNLLIRQSGDPSISQSGNQATRDQGLGFA
jgi:hypothetical protein